VAELVRGGGKTREGTVVSDKMDKTVVVAVASSVRDRLYKKIVRRLRRYMAHDEANDAKLGDRVRIVESRPRSRRKRWELKEVLVRAERPEVAAEEIDLELLGEVKVEEEEAPAPVKAAVAAEAAAEAPEEAPAEVETPEAELEAPELPEAAVEATEEEPPVEAEPEAPVKEPAGEAEETVEETVEEPEAAEAEEDAGPEPAAEPEPEPETEPEPEPEPEAEAKEEEESS
jgi:small subunit ribosomal protein S17